MKELYDEMVKLKVELRNCDKWMSYARERLEKIEQKIYEMEDKEEKKVEILVGDSEWMD